MRPSIALVLALLCTRCASLRATPDPTAAPHGTIEVGPTVGTSAAAVDSTLVPVGDSPSDGARDAWVTVVEFADFECPFSSVAEPTLHALRARYGRELRVVWKNLPLPFHPHALLAAEVAMEAFAQRGADGFWALHDAVLSHHGHLDSETLVTLAVASGVDRTQLELALRRHTHLAAIDRDIALASSLGIRGTPGFAVNGTVLVGARPEVEFVDLIDRIVAEAPSLGSRATLYARMTEAPLPPPAQTATATAGPPCPYPSSAPIP